jgi:tetratricopeptide (TPR) repeat protein
MKNFRRLNNVLGWITFAAASLVYLLTIEPTASWWDCGEYISTAFKLQVGHPPGAPLFQLVGRFFSLFAFGDVTQVAKMVNIMSALSSGFTILFLFWTITMLGLKFVKEDEMTTGQGFAILGSGLVGALAYTFSDSFWFSAVEGEVYAMSSFFTAIVFWAILKWDRVHDQPHSLRWILLIAFLVGLSVGVHLLNLLTIPAIALVIYFRKYQSNWKGIIYTLAISFFVLAFIMWWLIPWTVALAGKYEIAFVNSLGLPFNTGTIFYFILLIGSLVWGVRFTYRETHTTIEYILGGVMLLLLSIFSWLSFVAFLAIIGAYLWYKQGSGSRANRNQLRSVVNTGLLSIAFMLIGYSSFFILVIRANANTPINENDPSDAVSLLSYLNRDQYGSWPIFYGQYYDAPLDAQNPYKDGTPIYVKDNKSGKYKITDDRKNSIPNYDKRFCTIFPRMWSNQKDSHISAYKSWGKIKGIPITVTDDDGKTKTIIKPTFGENLRFFFRYQIGHMYMRYFMWNFAGRQNDIEGHGGIRYGNWISGIPFIDNPRLGDQSDLPSSMDNWARNKFYMLPLLLGLLGMYFHFKKHFNGALLVLLLFFMTGIAILVYLNITPQQPRERDYAFAGSFYAFAMWIGFGVMALWDALKKVNEKVIAVVVTVVCLLLVPGLMAKDGWNDHDRSNKYACRDFAADYLNSCAPNAILITNGDNDTFPLWYAQEVEGIRKDVRVVNFMLASGDWYVHQLKRKIYDSDPLAMTLRYDQYDKGVNEVVAYTGAYNERIELQDMIDYIASDDPGTKYQSGNRIISIFPTKKVKITVDTANLVKDGIVPKELAGKVVPEITWDIRTNYLYKNDLMLLDFLAKNKFNRPVYFASPSSINDAVNVDKYCFQEGFVYRFLPAYNDTGDYVPGLGSVNSEASFDILLHKCNWGNLADPGVYVDRESYRNTMIPKQNLARLARKLSQEGKFDKAVQVCDYVQKIFPDEKIHFDYYMIQFVESYYMAGAFDKGNKLAEKLVSIYEQNTSYIASLDPQFRANYEDDLNQAMGFFGALQQIADQYKQEKVSKRVEAFLNKTMGKS